MTTNATGGNPTGPFSADAKSKYIPVEQLEPGDILRHLGIIAGVQWYTIVMSVTIDEESGQLKVMETPYPLISERAYVPTSVMDVVAHDEDSLALARKMWATSDD